MHSTVRKSRRSLCFIVALGTLFLTPICRAQSNSCTLANHRQIGDLSKIKLLVRSQSQLKLTDAEGQEQVFPVQASGHLEFAERLVHLSDGACLVARDYRVAKTQLTGGTLQETSELSPERRLIAVRLDSEGITRKSLSGDLTHQELELISAPGDLTAAYQLLPNQQVEVGERWQPTHEALRDLLQFETVGVNETKMELVKVDRGLATMKLTGHLQGMVQGAVARVQITGDVRYDLNWQRINWVQLSVDDQRDEGPSSPSQRSLMELRMLVEPEESAERLAASAITQLTPADLSGPLLLTYDSPSGIRFRHESQWIPIADQQRRSVLRLVEGDRAIGQCQIARLTSLPAGKQTSLEEFERDVKHALGEQLSRMVAADQNQRQDGIRVLRAVAQGTVQEVPIQWTYYHLSDDQGARASLVFTVEMAHLEAFAQRDQVITSSLTLTTPQASPSPTTTPQTATGPHTPRR